MKFSNNKKTKYDISSQKYNFSEPPFARDFKAKKPKTKRRKRIWIPILAIAIFLIAAASFAFFNFQIAESVSVNGTYVGIVTDKASLDQITSDIGTVINSAANGSSNFNLDTKDVPIIIKKGTATPTFDLRQHILAICPNVAQAYAIYVNDALICACATEAESFDALNKVKEQYNTGTLIDIEFLDSVVTRNEYVAQNQILSVDDAVKMLNGDTKHREVYTTTTDEELANIAQRFSMDLSDLQSMNQNLSDIVPGGTKVNVLDTQANIRVQTKAIETYQTTISYGTDDVNDNKLPKGSKVLVSAGVNGQSTEKATVVRINGEEQDRIPISDTVTKQPVNEVYNIGTLDNGEAPVYSTTQFIWPVIAPITSPFSLGRVDPVTGVLQPHQGVDLGAAYGTSIKASASGTVTLAGWSNGYGNTIRIKTDNMYSEVYGHLSQILVKEGDTVTQGQVIGKVGSTGQSTGPHLHFEIHKNNVPVDPVPLLPAKK